MKIKWRWIAAGAAMVIVAGVLVGGVRIKAFTDLGAGYAARQTCSCVFVAGRTLESCLPDLPEGMDAATVNVDRKAERVSASIWPLSARVAAHEQGFGCVLD